MATRYDSCQDRNESKPKDNIIDYSEQNSEIKSVCCVKFRSLQKAMNSTQLFHLKFYLLLRLRTRHGQFGGCWIRLFKIQTSSLPNLRHRATGVLHAQGVALVIGHDVLHKGVTLRTGTEAELLRQRCIPSQIHFVNNDILDDRVLQSHFHLRVGLWWKLTHLWVLRQ